MEFIFVFIVIPALISLLAAAFITTLTRKKLIARNNQYVTAISIGVFILSSIIIFSAIAALILYNIRFER
ncbi:hypothetical protein OC25_05910 [Pedobacter kyungheensis]|uniref:Uncharacterized protein n=1 Tax=Pedobacter kyungheensis TaxID=1069985 RepID=A0A0C1DMW6_9SPHI|nr:hypothetical protein [Pedobacter kyungheensis]KIA95380.1 hypothetical protein OC25_05910 [Pedobacter kyungheensis]